MKKFMISKTEVEMIKIAKKIVSEVAEGSESPEEAIKDIISGPAAMKRKARIALLTVLSCGAFCEGGIYKFYLPSTKDCCHRWAYVEKALRKGWKISTKISYEDSGYVEEVEKLRIC